MLTIQLHQLQFFAYHGLYEAEKINGNHFELDVDINLNANGGITTIDQTLNYVAVYEIINARMKLSTPLLETLAEDLINLIRQQDVRIKSISLTIKKLAAPIPDFKGIVAVKLKKEY
jgi:dihydroneopterin aldolase